MDADVLEAAEHLGRVGAVALHAAFRRDEPGQSVGREEADEGAEDAHITADEAEDVERVVLHVLERADVEGVDDDEHGSREVAEDDGPEYREFPVAAAWWRDADV